MKRSLCIILCLALLLPLFAYAQSTQELALLQAEACVFSSEYGGDHDCVMKWETEIRVFFDGRYQDNDIDFFYSFIKQLKQQVPEAPTVVIVNDKESSNVVFHFVRLDEMRNVLPSYVSGNWGFFTYYNNGNGRITRAQIGIAWDVCDKEARRHLMMEEFVGVLGAANDHYLDQSSILYQLWTTVQKLTDADWLMLRMLYSSRIPAGMAKTEALGIMKTIR